MFDDESELSESEVSVGLVTFLHDILLDKDKVGVAYYSDADHDSEISTWSSGPRKIKQHPRLSQLSQVATMYGKKWYVKPDTAEGFVDKVTAAVMLANKHNIRDDRMIDMGGVRKDYPVEGVLIPLKKVGECRCCSKLMNHFHMVDGQMVSRREGWNMDVVWDKDHSGTSVYDELFTNERSYVHASVMFNHAHIHRWYNHKIPTPYGELYEFEYRIYTSLRSVIRTLLLGRGKLERFFELPIPMIRTYNQCCPLVQKIWMWYSAIVYTAAYPKNFPVETVVKRVVKEGKEIMDKSGEYKTYALRSLDIRELDIYVKNNSIPPKIKALILKHMEEEIFMCNKLWMDAIPDVKYPFCVRRYTKTSELIGIEEDWY
jgi:hypothetical protein